MTHIAMRVEKEEHKKANKGVYRVISHSHHHTFLGRIRFKQVKNTKTWKFYNTTKDC